MYAQVQQRRRGRVMASTAYVHCTQTDKAEDAVVIEHTDKKLVVGISVLAGEERARLVLYRKDVRRPYVGQLGQLEFTVLDADIE